MVQGRAFMSPVAMGKSKADVPLTVISPNEPVHGFRGKKRQTLVSSPHEGKENTLRRSNRWSLQTNAGDGRKLESPRSSTKMPGSQKRTRSLALTDPSSASRLRGEDKRSQGQGNISGSQAIAPVVHVRNEEDFLPNCKNVPRNIPITVISDHSSPSDDGILIGAPVGKAVHHDFNCPDEHRVEGCAHEQNKVPDGEMAAGTFSKAVVVSPVQDSPEESGRRLSSGKKAVSMKTYRRRASKGGISPCVPDPQEVLGTSTDIVNLQTRDENHGIEFWKSSNLQSTIASATDALQSAYDHLYKKYQNLKSRQLADVEMAFEEQSRRIEVFVRAADNLVQDVKTTDQVQEYQEEILCRSRLLEDAYIECQNDLVLERARNLELRKHLENAELHGNKLLHEVLENTTHLTISKYGKSEIVFSHNQSGYEFRLEKNELSDAVGGQDALLYSVVSPGTILHRGPDWMRSEIVFDMVQVQVFFRRILAVALCEGPSV